MKVLLIFLLQFLFVIFSYQNIEDHEVVVRVVGGPLIAQLLAQETGYKYGGPVSGFPDTFILQPLPIDYRLNDYQKRDSKISKRIIDNKNVLWADKQIPKERQKRDFQIILPSKRSEKPQRIFKRPTISKADKTFNDELWSQQWYLRDTRTHSDLPKLDLNVLPLYKAGVTGKGIRISILDDGIEYTHEDLKDNYDPEISWDCNENDNDPLPRYDTPKSNSHGTRCAGEVSMMANNIKCGVGIAFNSKIGGVKLLDGIVTDRIEGTALSYAQHLVDIYSASWGPNDDGKTVDGPGRLAQEALENGIKFGRNGKGTIYVWASGNGGNKNDNCNCDGYLATIYTVSIGSASQKGEFPWYGEACASTLGVTYSSGAYKDQMITTTDLNNECTIKHTGTSASAPLAAGIIALALEVNPNLTWRDVQHLIVWTSELAPLVENAGWQQNAAGLWFNTRFGFGLMNAFGLVSLAANWTNVPEKSIVSISIHPIGLDAVVSFEKPAQLFVEASEVNNVGDVQFLEHVQVRMNINYTVRGALDILLVSPSGTQVQLLAPRLLDESDRGFIDWTFMSVMNWGETAEGIWKIVISDKKGPEKNIGTIGTTTLILHGTKTMPNHMLKGPRNYNHDYNRIQDRVGAFRSNAYFEPPQQILMDYFY